MAKQEINQRRHRFIPVAGFSDLMGQAGFVENGNSQLDCRLHDFDFLICVHRGFPLWSVCVDNHNHRGNPAGRHPFIV